MTDQRDELKKMKFWEVPCAGLLAMVFLSLPRFALVSDLGAETRWIASDYVPIKWAIVVLGKFDYYTYPPSNNAIQKIEHWVQSEGVPYDIIPEDSLEAPTDKPVAGKYSLQYANGTAKYGVVTILLSSHNDPSAVNPEYIYSAVRNGTNAVVFGTAAKYVPRLLNTTPNNVSYILDRRINQINCIVRKTFSDGVAEYGEGAIETIDGSYPLHADVSDAEGKTVWYTMSSNTGRRWIGMMNTTYGLGKVFWSTVIPSSDVFLYYGTFSDSWETRNLKFVAHAINFMFHEVEKIDFGLQGYKSWGGAITYKLEQDTALGLTRPPQSALEAGWYVDLVVCPLGYLTTGGTLMDGMPRGYSGAPTSRVKFGTWTNLVNTTNPLSFASVAFILYSSNVTGIYDRVVVDWNHNRTFSDDPSFRIWENMTSYVTRLAGTYYWGYIDNWEDPRLARLGWWCPLSQRTTDFWWWKEMGRRGYILYGLQGWQHQSLGSPSEKTGSYVCWNGSYFVLNQTWVGQKLLEARDELAYCLGSDVFDADRVLVSHPGNEYTYEVDSALFDLDWVQATYGDNSKNEPGWFVYDDRKPAMTCGGGSESPDVSWRFEALRDAVGTLFPIFGISGIGEGSYNLSFNVSPQDTAYTDMFRFAHLDESFEFWSNSRYLRTNTVSAYYKDSKIVLEYKANSTLRDYVWRFPVTYNGRHFSGFSDNRTAGEIKHIDGEYVYIEISEGGNERLEVTYGIDPHICQTSRYFENMTETYEPKKLTVQLWGSGSLNIKADCSRLGLPKIARVGGAATEFEYNSSTKICTLNVFLRGRTTLEVLWDNEPPNPPTLISPALASWFDLGKTLPFEWKLNDPDIADSQTAYRFQLSAGYDFASPLIDTGKAASGPTQTIQTLPNTVGLYYWRVMTWDSHDAKGEWSVPSPVIVDRLKVISKGVTDDRVSVRASASVHFCVIREFDNSSFDGTQGTVYINGSPAIWDDAKRCWVLNVTQDSVGDWSYKVSSITDDEHHIETIVDLVGTQRVIWDKLVVSTIPEGSTAIVGTEVNFVVTAVYAYDNASVPIFTVIILRDGALFAAGNFTDTSNVEGTHSYTVESIFEKTYGPSAFDSNLAVATWSAKPSDEQLAEWLTSKGLVLVVSIAQSLIALTYVIVKERKKSGGSSQQSNTSVAERHKGDS